MADAERMRDRLRELGRSTRKPHSADLEARVVEHLRVHGPVTIRRGRQRRTLMAAGAVVLPLALVAGWIGLRSADEQPREVAHRQASTKPVPAPICAGRAVATTAFIRSPDGAQFLDLGERGRIVLDRGGEATLEASNPCQLEVTLAAGRVTVHAQNLLGGELSVRAGTAEVVVHGTLFAVERTDEALAVDVVEGVVSVESEGRELAPRIRAGQSLRLAGARTPSLLALSTETRAQLQAALRAGSAPVVEAPARVRSAAEEPVPKLGAAKLLARADQHWQNGELEEARARYREAGAASGPTAEAAWLALARRELSIGQAAAARRALSAYDARFPEGELAAEAASVAFRAALLERDVGRADRLARSMIERFPGTPQAEAARRWRREQRR